MRPMFRKESGDGIFCWSRPAVSTMNRKSKPREQTPERTNGCTRIPFHSTASGENFSVTVAAKIPITW